MARVAFILKPDKSEAGVLFNELVPWLRDRGHVPVVTAEDQITNLGPNVEVVSEAELGNAVDLAVALGGDGTMLRAARVVADQGRPVLGINFGGLGFLAGFSPGNAKTALASALDGTLPRVSRMRLAVSYLRPGEPVVTRYALNDAVLHQGAMARLVDIEAFVDGAFVAAYRADGLIVATPTGSTAYNMAAGGPIVVSGQHGLLAMVLTPICAHALTNRPLVLDANAKIRLQLAADVRGALLTVDAQSVHDFSFGDTVEVTAAAAPLVMFGNNQSFFDVMRDKLHWGARSDRGRGGQGPRGGG